jgi:23S rRNA (cytidine2498-2'-O)-methyltransferase
MSQSDDGQPTARAVLFSTAEPYFGAAQAALRQNLPGTRTRRLGPEVGQIVAREDEPGIDVGQVAAVCRGIPIPFVRHLANQHVWLPPGAVDRAPGAAVDLLHTGGTHAVERHEPLHRDIALQVWTSGTPGGPRAESVRAGIEAALREAGVITARGGREHVLGVCVTSSGTSLGLTPSRDALADWPGGRVILARPAEQVSRAEWKLEELVKVFDVPWPVSSGRAVDLGASPGGWSRILRMHGYEVWAVDPGDLHPRVAADPGVHHVRTTAGQFLSAPPSGRFDVVVNDMRMVAERSARVMVDAARLLVPEGLIIMTLKVSQHRAARTVERALAPLRRRFRPLFVRQLFHNKNEVTLVAQRTGEWT